jgi:hypothetical protein
VTIVQPSIPKAVPTAVAFSADNSVPIVKAAIKGPYKPMTGSSINPSVPATENEAPAQPTFHAWGQSAPTEIAGSLGAPSVPTDGFLFRAQPIDQHYTVETETRNPYHRVNHLHTVGWWTRVQSFQNNIAMSQNKDNAGWNVRAPQQRTSVMLNALPPHGEFGTRMTVPTQQPQAVRYNRIVPSTGSDPYGSGKASSMGGYMPGRVLNNDSYGAGQTAGGVGGSNYTPTPGPPNTNSITAAPASPEATWG